MVLPGTLLTLTRLLQNDTSITNWLDMELNAWKARVDYKGQFQYNFMLSEGINGEYTRTSKLCPPDLTTGGMFANTAHFTTFEELNMTR